MFTPAERQRIARVLNEAARAIQREWEQEQDTPLLVYMTTEDGATRDAAYLRMYAEHVRNKTDVTWEIPHTRAKTLAGIADRIEARAEQAEADLSRYKALVESEGVGLIAAERRRQVEAEGWTPEHDVELAEAAVSYALVGSTGVNRRQLAEELWPLEPAWWKPGDPIRNLVKAGALIAAKIERLKRALVETEHG